MEHTLLDFNLRVMAPELIIVSAAALLVILELLLKESTSRNWIGWLGLLAVIAAGVSVGMEFGHPPYQILNDSYRVDSFSLAFKALLLGGGGLTILFSLAGGKNEQPKPKGEYYILLLAALLGGMMMVSSADLLALYVGLELLSLSSYILVGINKRDRHSNEAAWKYVVLGGVSSAFLLYGMSFLYGLTGATNLFAIQGKMVEMVATQDQAYIYVSLFLMMVGFGFKIATAPFHTWTPDVYQGSPTPVTIFLAVVSKAAAFALVARVLLIAYLPLVSTGAWNEIVSWLLMILAACSMIIGNTAALRQTNAKRLLAYSSIAQAGYVLVPLSTLGFVGFDLFPSLFYYLCAYLFMTAGAFAVADCIAKSCKNDQISAFAGLSRRSPWLAGVMTIFLISLAGFPVTAGFFGKFYLLTSAVGSNQAWLAAAMILTTIVSYYYYFEFIRQMYFRAPDLAAPRVSVSWAAWAVLAIGVTGTLALGLFPDLLLHELGKIDWHSAFAQAQNAIRQ
ncbi:NADH-quinone oxidoreductase subunit N [Thermoactinomyces daqus]|uniref:NADH-quinone oxidoreductase subunit N n=1 Tax=Thermoactinomyces daqus TaxID=1329516 RepID=A0A7W1X843_9BACL|nr:NADH-quinone oxidoreductase subunit N [Thermoactinomyces daqus]MBA4541823.1 NADH-quinone oxidoreductase subunit N [Thermoactinomyces daqus]